jgi:hypothetical protein
MESSLMRLGFEVMMRTHLSVVHCGRMMSCIKTLPGSAALGNALRTYEIMPSYVWYIPRHMGKSRCLDSAVDLVFSAAGYLAMPPHPDVQSSLMRKSLLALSTLQMAIQDPVESMSVEVLAAVSLLSSYEVKL